MFPQNPYRSIKARTFLNRSDLTILVAEDNLKLLDIYEKSLSAEGYRLVLVKSCERALAELHEKEANLFIADLQMLDMTGIEMLTLIARNHPQLPVIVVSGTYDGGLEDFHEKGFKDVKAFFRKPVSMDILKSKIREVLKIKD